MTTCSQTWIQFCLHMICLHFQHLFILLWEQYLGDLINMVAFHFPKEFCGQFMSPVPIKHNTSNFIPQLFLSKRNFSLGKQFTFESLVFGALHDIRQHWMFVDLVQGHLQLCACPWWWSMKRGTVELLQAAENLKKKFWQSYQFGQCNVMEHQCKTDAGLCHRKLHSPLQNLSCVFRCERCANFELV